MRGLAYLWLLLCRPEPEYSVSPFASLEAAGYLRIQQGQPIQTPFWAAGLAFSTAAAVREVPYDLYTPYLFDGEEISTAARLWTHGYDFYAPITDTVFHVYESAYKRNKYWEIDWQERSQIQMRR